MCPDSEHCGYRHKVLLWNLNIRLQNNLLEQLGRTAFRCWKKILWNWTLLLLLKELLFARLILIPWFAVAIQAIKNCFSSKVVCRPFWWLTLPRTLIHQPSLFCFPLVPPFKNPLFFLLYFPPENAAKNSETYSPSVSPLEFLRDSSGETSEQ